MLTEKDISLYCTDKKHFIFVPDFQDYCIFIHFLPKIKFCFVNIVIWNLVKIKIADR